MCCFIKRIFKCFLNTKKCRYCITYIYKENYATELYYYCDACDESVAKTKFIKLYNERYHYIISIKKINYLNKLFMNFHFKY